MCHNKACTDLLLGIIFETVLPLLIYGVLIKICTYHANNRYHKQHKAMATFAQKKHFRNVAILSIARAQVKKRFTNASYREPVAGEISKELLR